MLNKYSHENIPTIPQRNQTIYQFAKESGLDVYALGLDHEKWKKCLNAFSESIIQECMSQIALIGISNSENEDISWACHKAVENIKEQFGIE